MKEAELEPDDTIEIEGNKIETQDGYLKRLFEWFNGDKSYLSNIG